MRGLRAAALLVLLLCLFAVVWTGLEAGSDRVLRARAETVLATVRFAQSGITVDDPPLDEAIDHDTWVLDASGRVLTPGHADRVVLGLAGVRAPTRRDDGRLRLLAVPVLDRGTVVVGVDGQGWGPILPIPALGVLALGALMVAGKARRADAGRLGAELAHELRAPLARLRAETELALLRPRRSAQLLAVLRSVAAHTRELTQVVDTLTDVTADHGMDCSVADVVARAGLGPLATPGLRVRCDAGMAVRILAPLLGNARAYGTVAGLQVRAEPSAVVLTVTDDGPGVRQEERESIFEPGRRGSAADLSPGSGLGLALARRLARQVGGEVTAVPSPDGGRFELRLPRSG